MEINLPPDSYDFSSEKKEVARVLKHRPNDADFVTYSQNGIQEYLVEWMDGIETWESANRLEREIPYLVNSYWYDIHPSKRPNVEMNAFIELEGFMVKRVLKHFPKGQTNGDFVKMYKIAWANDDNHFTWENKNRLLACSGIAAKINDYWKNLKPDKPLDVTVISNSDSEDTFVSNEEYCPENSPAPSQSPSPRKLVHKKKWGKSFKSRGTKNKKIYFKTPEQIKILEEEIYKDCSMSIAKADRIAEKTGLEPRQIKQWFQIERFKRGLRSSNGKSKIL